MAMDRPVRFEHFRWLGDKRTQIVYDLDNLGDEDAPMIEEILQAESFLAFGPDTLPEARNRGYKPFKGNGSGQPDVDPYQ